MWGNSPLPITIDRNNMVVFNILKYHTQKLQITNKELINKINWIIHNKDGQQLEALLQVIDTVDVRDYDDRTPLHVALDGFIGSKAVDAVHHRNIISSLMKKNPRTGTTVVDRWGNMCVVEW